MYLSRPDVLAAATACEAAGQSVGELIARGSLVEEDDVTSVLIDRIRTRVAGLSISGVHWDARKTTSRSRGSEEHRSGADLLGVLEVNLPEITLRKGFLAQAKLYKFGKMKRLRDQCAQMLEISPDSYVFLFDKRGVQVVPALLYATGSLGMKHVEPWPLSQFFEAHFSSFIGDRRLSATTKAEFAQLLPDVPIPKDILVVSATSDQGDTDAT
jgi:hypothetical protein